MFISSSNTTNGVIKMNNLELIKKSVSNYVAGKFELPKIEGKKNFYIIPLSGGLDSFATAYTLLALYPATPFCFVHCDTGIEAEGTEEAFERFEAVTGRSILKIKPKYGLLEGVEKHGNFLPSQRHRSCTQTLKTLPIKKFFNALKEKFGDDSVFIQFVGLRADEPQREGIEWAEEHIASSYPLQSLGIRKEDVNLIVERIQGIPRYYQDKSRSGCKICIFSRRSEIIAAWNNSPVDLERAANTEEIPVSTLNIYNAMPTPVSKILNVGRNWVNYYRPSELGYKAAGFESSRGKNKLVNGIDDMFGASDSKRLYVAIEYFYEANTYGFLAQPMVFFEKLISYSTSMAGIKKALKHFWLHRLHTKEMYDQSEERLAGERQVYIFEVEVDDFENEIPPAPQGVFTWQNDRTPLFAIRKAVAVLERILLTEGEKQNVHHYDPTISKQAVNSVEKLKSEKEYGRILSVTKYQKPPMSELVDDFDITDAPVACMACSR